MLSRDQRDPAATPRLLLTLLAVALLWPGIRLAELNPLVLLQADNARTMGSFLAGFWPVAHSAEFLGLLLDATLQTLAIATAGIALPYRQACSPARHCRCRPPHVAAAPAG